MPDRHWLLHEGFIPFDLYGPLGGMCQDHWEFGITHLILKNFSKPFQDILEVGTFGGWTMMAWLLLSNPGAKAVCVDMLKNTSAPLPPNVIFLERDSHDPETLREVNKLLPTGVDFLFIDGDHSLRGCAMDWNMYAPLVRPGGIVGFHDILIGDVRATWREVMRRYPSVQVQDYAPDGSRMGLGLIFRLPHVGPFTRVEVEDV